MDALPARNLPPDSEQWGRTLEDHLRAVDEGTRRQEQEAQGLNRTIASQLAADAYQSVRLANLEAGVAALSAGTALLAGSLPDTRVFGDTSVGWGLGSSYSTLASVSIPQVSGRTCRAFIAWDISSFWPAEIDSNTVDTRLAFTGGIPTSSARVLAEGYLFLGGDFFEYVAGQFAHSVTSASAFTVSVEARVLIGTPISPTPNSLANVSVTACYV